MSSSGHSTLPFVKGRAEHRSNARPSRLPYLPNRFRNELVAFTGEFCGTFMFLFIGFMACGMVVASHPPDPNSPSPPNPPNLLYIAFAFGFSLATNAWVFFRVSGGLFNPAVSPSSSSLEDGN
jgi:aquaporin rerated protein, other eukaryote